jgi:hypothetical protein
VNDKFFLFSNQKRNCIRERKLDWADARGNIAAGVKPSQIKSNRKKRIKKHTWLFLYPCMAYRNNLENKWKFSNRSITTGAGPLFLGKIHSLNNHQTSGNLFGCWLLEISVLIFCFSFQGDSPSAMTGRGRAKIRPASHQRDDHSKDDGSQEVVSAISHRRPSPLTRLAGSQP